jgi:hypothetical protein
MMTIDQHPSADSSYLRLGRPTTEELNKIDEETASAWRDALTHSTYLKESSSLRSGTLGRNCGMTNWILVDGRLPPNQRPILSSCETFRKLTLMSDSNGKVADTIVYGIASVFCPRQYRGRSYAKRMMQELALKLPTYRTDRERCIGSILFSDIGRSYYAKLGWQPRQSNMHVEFRAGVTPRSTLTTSLKSKDLPELCNRDEAQLRKMMAMPTEEVQTRMAVIPNDDHISWHLSKEGYACDQIFMMTPQNKGAIAGSPGQKVWAIWTHRYFDHPRVQPTRNVLIILRLVVEGDPTATRLRSDARKRPDHNLYEMQKSQLQAVLQDAQHEALEWKLGTVQLWDPTPLVRQMLTEIDIEHEVVEREDQCIASGMWYDDKGNISDVAPLWMNNEHYAWC